MRHLYGLDGKLFLKLRVQMNVILCTGFGFVLELNEVEPTMKLFDITQQDRFTAILTMYQSFIEKERLDNPTFDYWSSYIDMAHGLLLFLRATREAD